MREIKFRAWDEPSMSMIEDADIKQAKFYNQPLMQFTGLHDINGKEIYEGDISTTEGIDAIVGEVRWNKKGFWDIWLHKENCFETSMMCSDDFDIPINKHTKVIGNIYENSELLKEKETR